jgi:uncharacterized protein Veg
LTNLNLAHHKRKIEMYLKGKHGLAVEIRQECGRRKEDNSDNRNKIKHHHLT